MNPKVILLIVLVLALACVLLCRSGGSEGEQGDPTARWVCDSCGKAMSAPLKDASIDCPGCETGQMVQRVFFKCKKCEKVFEAYQKNWSPTAERGAAARAEADAQARMPAAEEGGEAPPQESALAEPPAGAGLVRRPGGQWVWEHLAAGRQIMSQLSCPNCGARPRKEFTKVLNPDTE